MTSRLSVVRAVLASVALALPGCGGASFSGSSSPAAGPGAQPAPDGPPKPAPSEPVAEPPRSPAPVPEVADEPEVDQASAAPIDCSTKYAVPGTANPYFALVDQGVEVTYLAGDSDNSSTEAPVEVAFTDTRCLTAGSRLSFVVGGKIKHGPDLPETGPDGALNETWPHEGGAAFGKSHIVAPLNSLVGVFLGKSLPATAPAAMHFEGEQARNYTELKPAIGQIFFIGDGKDAAAVRQTVIVPDGAAHFFFGIMDSYGWHNNDGQLEGTVQWQAR